MGPQRAKREPLSKERLPTQRTRVMNDKKMMQIVGAVQRTVGDDKKTWWTKIGVAFQNKDGSYNLRFDYLPAHLADTTIQLREFDSQGRAQPTSSAARRPEAPGPGSAGPRRGGARKRLAPAHLPNPGASAMHDDELHRFKSDIHFLHYAADRYGYQRDRRESSVASHVLRHPATDDKIVVRKDRDGHWTYFSVRDDRDHGTIIDFVQRRGRHLSLGSVREELRSWLGTARPVPDSLEPPRRSAVARSTGRWPRCSRRHASRPRATTSPRGAFAPRPCPTRASRAPGASMRAETCSSHTATKQAC